MNQRFHSAAFTGGEEGPCAPSCQLQVPAESLAVEQELLAEAALLFAIRAVADNNEFSMRQQVGLWRPFR